MLFAWAANQDYFKELTDSDLRLKLLREKEKLIEESMLPAMIVDAGMDTEETITINNSNPDSEDTIW